MRFLYFVVFVEFSSSFLLLPPFVASTLLPSLPSYSPSHSLSSSSSSSFSSLFLSEGEKGGGRGCIRGSSSRGSNNNSRAISSSNGKRRRGDVFFRDFPRSAFCSYSSLRLRRGRSAMMKMLVMIPPPVDFVQEFNLVREWEFLFSLEKSRNVELAVEELPTSWRSLLLSSKGISVRLGRDKRARLKGGGGGGKGGRATEMGIWDFKRRMNAGRLEIEVMDDEENPRLILLLKAEVTTGKYQPNVIKWERGKIIILHPPFLPWNKTELGSFTVKCKTPKAVVDPNLS